MPMFRCYNCKVKGMPGYFHEFEADRGVCPQCHAAEPAVLRLTDVHMLVPHERGPFEGIDGTRRHLACDPNRDALGLHPGDTFAATEDVRAVTCPACKRHDFHKAMAKQLAAADPGFRIDKTGCC